MFTFFAQSLLWCLPFSLTAANSGGAAAGQVRTAAREL
jgi:hypothetical protein